MNSRRLINSCSSHSIGRSAFRIGSSLQWPIALLSILLLLPSVLFPGEQLKQSRKDESYISTKTAAGAFALAASGRSASLLVSSRDFPAVLRVVRDLQSDIRSVARFESPIHLDTLPKSGEIVIVGTLGTNPLIDELVREGKIDVNGIVGMWEASLIQVVEHPFPGIMRALIIAGSDKRGTVYGVYDLCAKIGVSPWYWWADVPAKRQPNLYVLPGRRTLGSPAVKYRGIFINDEAPALSGWVTEKFGGFNHAFYEKVFELILRMKGNYLWPAMWGRAFYDDDSLNPKLADEYGVVIGTSHHEPMMRAHDEWRRYGKGAWNYEKNDSVLRSFWQQGIRRMKNYESIVTIGMRGDGDEPMSQESNISLLERIVKDQRQILGEVTEKGLSSIPQIWALYKEVQEYYDKGMRVPDDVTLLLCDDNWGNIRKLPKTTDAPRAGGYGMYYHYDYVGGPRNYKWLNTNQISRVWEQMHLAYSYGVDRIWIVNVGDIKPMEFPTQFFLDYSWNPNAWPAERLPEYTRQWGEQQFGVKYATDIADILTKYTQYNSRRKPELITPNTYSLVNYREAETVVADYKNLAKRAQRISDALPKELRDAFYQLVLHPVLACSNLNELYVTVGKNHLYANQGRAATNALAAEARILYLKDSAISLYYNRTMAKGKWNHMMDQTHIGYTYWQQPDSNMMPAVTTISIPVLAGLGVAVEGSERSWPADSSELVLPEFDRYNQQRYFIDIFNRGTTPFSYTLKTNQPWMKVNAAKGTCTVGDRVWLSVDWKKAPAGMSRIPIVISGPKRETVTIQAIINNPSSPDPGSVNGFVESNGCVSIEAEHFSRAAESSTLGWQKIPDLGRTLSAMAPVPVTAASQTPGADAPHLEYPVYLFDKGNVTVSAYLSPTLNFHNDAGLRYAVSFDDQPPQVVNMHAGKTFQDWEESVRNNVSILKSTHTITEPGRHLLKYWMVDPGVVLQKLVVETKNVRPAYLGPPESYRGPANAPQTK
ncbi:MAG: glycosyl hydrolase 115 family protein [Ignavibacteriales bacterium]|nr:glycosyl hydrolase 115 family protein [Ignavibacteriales bacterium]